MWMSLFFASWTSVLGAMSQYIWAVAITTWHYWTVRILNQLSPPLLPIHQQDHQLPVLLPLKSPQVIQFGDGYYKSEINIMLGF